jgi:DNA-binding winged helix-turn-helix (wHTH) protein
VAVELTLLSRVAYRDQEVTGPRLRGLLALLASDLRTGCSTARLVEGLWPDEQSENPTKALQVLVSRARAQLGADVIATTPTGYQLALGRSATSSSWASPSSSSSPALGGSVRSREPGIGPARKISVNSASA